jgi:hypothetical protein
MTGFICFWVGYRARNSGRLSCRHSPDTNLGRIGSSNDLEAISRAAHVDLSEGYGVGVALKSGIVPLPGP